MFNSCLNLLHWLGLNPKPWTCRHLFFQDDHPRSSGIWFRSNSKGLAASRAADLKLVSREEKEEPASQLFVAAAAAVSSDLRGSTTLIRFFIDSRWSSPDPRSCLDFCNGFAFFKLELDLASAPRAGRQSVRSFSIVPVVTWLISWDAPEL